MLVITDSGWNVIALSSEHPEKASSRIEVIVSGIVMLESFIQFLNVGFTIKELLCQPRIWL